MASRFRDFSRGTVRGSGSRLGGGSTSLQETSASSVDIDATGLIDFFKQREQDKVDRTFLKKNAEEFGFTEDEIDTFSREDLRNLKTKLVEESAQAGVQGGATQNFLDLFNQVPEGEEQEAEELKALFGEALQQPEQPSTREVDGIREMNVLGLGGEEAQLREPTGRGLTQEQFDIESIAPTPIAPDSGLRPSIPIGSVQPRSFGEFVDSASDPSGTPMQKIQDALIQLNPRDASRIQDDPIFTGLLEMAKRRPQSGQLVQAADGGMWNVTFDTDGNVKKEEKLNVKKAPSSLNNTTKVLQVQRKDGSLGMDAVTFNSKGELTNQVPVPGAVPKSFKIDIGGVTKPTKTKIEQELISIKTDLNEISNLKESLFASKGLAKELLTPLGRVKAGFFELMDRAGAFDTDLPVGKIFKSIESITGTKVQKETRARVKEFRRVENQVGRIFTKFRKEITGVAGPPEEFERLEAISLSIRKLGPAGMEAAIQVLEDAKRDQRDLLSNSFLASNKKEFLKAMGVRLDTRIEELRAKFRDNPEMRSAINKADSAVISEQETRRDIVGQERRFNSENMSNALKDMIDAAMEKGE